MKSKQFIPALFLLTVLLLPSAVLASNNLPDFVNLAKSTGQAVVNINTVKTVEVSSPNIPDLFRFHGQNSPFEDFFKQFNERFKGNSPKHKQKQGSLGSGFLISKDGYIVTNNHVIASADEIHVKLHDNGKDYPAKIVGRDKEADLALIKIKTDKDLPHLDFGDSDNSQVGEWVLAIGNPFGLGHTVTKGIISAKGRIIGAGPFDDFIQTDASINPGNSGGPLINMNGQVIGINTAIIASGQGIGFAIPSNMAKNVIEQLKSGKKVHRGWLGVTIQNVDENTAKALKMEKPAGALVNSVNEGDPADKGGMKVGDVIIKVDGEKVADTNALLRKIAILTPGTKAEITVWRKGREKDLTITLGERGDKGLVAENNLPNAPAKDESIDKLGIAVRPVTRDTEAKALGMKKPHGLIIVGVKDDSVAQDAGLRPGDVILEANQKSVDSVDSLKSIVNSASSKRGLLLLMRRQGHNSFLTIEIK
ncbi:DegQ family serine endoprotease [Maridesulfovibrio bastinii]|uniref:DegQ family serine endoprotease n=1 Tax=Maridesulfovibrio bastinii TaxID=47157 RepID=UPI000418740E|nr:DegQ family serine endoprotease [Maridesulfovibrio bastinii]